MSGVITYQMVVDQSGAVKSISQVETVLKQSERAFDNQTAAINRSKKALGEQSRATNLAGMTALEFSRIASDSAYGIRGMANNIGQVTTMFTLMMSEVDGATKKTLGFWGAAKAVGLQMLGPMGIIVAIQGVLSLLTLWESRNERLRKEQEKLKEQINEVSKALDTKIRRLTDLTAVLSVATTNTSLYRKTLNEISSAIPGLSDSMNIYGASVEDVVAAVDKHIESMRVEFNLMAAISDLRQSLAKKTALANDVAEREAELMAKTGLSAEELTKRYKENRVVREKGGGLFSRFLNTENAELQKQKELVGNVNTTIDVQREAIEELAKKWNGYYKEHKATNKEKKQWAEYEHLQIETAKLGYEELMQVFHRITAMQMAAHKQIVERMGFLNYKTIFSNEALANIRLFGQHLDAISGTMFAMGNTFGNVASIIDDGSEEMEKRLKTLYEIQQGFAIASITVDTLVAMSKVTAETPFLAFLKNAQILAQGVAGVTAVLAQKPGRSSQLRGVKNSSIGTAQDDTVPVTTTGFSNLAGGEKPNQDIRVYVMGSDIRSVQDRSTRTKVRAKL